MSMPKARVLGGPQAGGEETKYIEHKENIGLVQQMIEQISNKVGCKTCCCILLFLKTTSLCQLFLYLCVFSSWEPNPPPPKQKKQPIFGFRKREHLDCSSRETLSRVSRKPVEVTLGQNIRGKKSYGLRSTGRKLLLVK